MQVWVNRGGHPYVLDEEEKSNDIILLSSSPLFPTFVNGGVENTSDSMFCSITL